jgi:hypothetical protein
MVQCRKVKNIDQARCIGAKRSMARPFAAATESATLRSIAEPVGPPYSLG